MARACLRDRCDCRHRHQPVSAWTVLHDGPHRDGAVLVADAAVARRRSAQRTAAALWLSVRQDRPEGHGDGGRSYPGRPHAVPDHADQAAGGDHHAGERGVCGQGGALLAYRGLARGRDRAGATPEHRIAAAHRRLRRQRRFCQRVRHADRGRDLWRRSAGDRPYPP